MKKILICEDDPLVAQSLSLVLGEKAALTIVSHLEAALRHPHLDLFDLYLIDCDLNEEFDGIRLLEAIRSVSGRKIMLTGRDQGEVIERAYLAGADDYLAKPLCHETLLKSIQLNDSEDIIFDQELSDKFGWESSFNLSLYRAAQGDLPIYLSGESGVGKTILAELIHRVSRQKKGPFIALNCSELNESLMESEIFGHEKGAFTGALKTKKGKLELAHRGTLFLDEVATMPQTLQVKLLKVLEEKRFFPVGSERVVQVDFRIIAATCEDLEEKVRAGNFREDLYFRLMAYRFELPALRENRGHLNQLIQKYLNRGQRRLFLCEEAKSALLQYDWPGNYRELFRELEIMTNTPTGFIQKKDLSSKFFKLAKIDDQNNLLGQVLEQGLKPFLRQLEGDLIRQCLEQNNGQVRKTIEQLKISTHSFYHHQN